jgi:aspartate/methionine/tyrosine aminotransferase
VLEVFQMERMQSTWENVVDYDLSESGIRAITLRELVELGFDLDAALDTPLSYSQSNGTVALRERIAALYPGATPDHIEVTNGTSEANYVVALATLRPGDVAALEVPNYYQLWGVPRSVGATVATFPLCLDRQWEPDWDAFDRAVTPRTRLVYISNPNNPTGAILSGEAMERIVERCDHAGTYLLADEVYQGAELDRPLTPSFWGMSDRVIVTSGLSKAYGIPGVRIGWVVGPPAVVATCWSQHDYLTIAPSKLSDRIAQVAVSPDVRSRLYSRTRAILKDNLPLMSRWVARFGNAMRFEPPQAGAIAFLGYDPPAFGSLASADIADRIRQEQSTLIVPGSQFGLENHLRIWLGGRTEFLTTGLARVAQSLDALRD